MFLRMQDLILSKSNHFLSNTIFAIGDVAVSPAPITALLENAEINSFPLKKVNLVFILTF